MDLAQLAAADYADLPIGGSVYRVGELKLRDWAPVQAWIKATVPGPLSSLGSADFKALPRDVKKDVLDRVLEQDRTSWPPVPGSTSWISAIDHEGGHAVLLLALLSRHQPAISLEDCQAIAERATPLEVIQAVLAGLGLTGPKSPTPASPATKARKKARARAGARRATTSATSSTSSPTPGAGPPTRSST